MFAAIIVAGGSSRRMGFDKLMTPLGGVPVLLRSIQAFAGLAEVGTILVVVREDGMEAARELAISVQKEVRLVAGGTERHLSVWNGLQAVPDGTKWVAVHDGARPLVAGGDILRCLVVAREHGAAALASRVTDTLKREDEAGMIAGGVERAGVWAMQTPQIFRLDLLRSAYKAVIERSDVVTDETSAVAAVGAKVALVEAEDWNPKITFAKDLELAEAMLRSRAGAEGGDSRQE